MWYNVKNDNRGGNHYEYGTQAAENFFLAFHENAVYCGSDSCGGSDCNIVYTHAYATPEQEAAQESYADAYTAAQKEAGGPYSMTINDIVLNDILVGDVFLCSGQSNKELSHIEQRYFHILLSRLHIYPLLD